MPPVLQKETPPAVVLLTLAAAVWVAAWLPTPAEAAPLLCRQLERTLARTVNGSNGGMARAYDRAVAAQTEAIAKTRRRMAAASCSPSFFNIGGCGRLQASLKEMQANLGALRRARAGMRDAGPAAERRRILASLEANGCRGAEAAPAWRQREVPVPPEQAAAGGATNRPRGGQPFCVRTCDGYFFPMTRTTAPVEDQAVCEAACPGTPMDVFYSRKGGTPDAMVSGRTSRPYSALETANLFRDAGRPRPAGCACNANKGFRIVSKSAANRDERAASSHLEDGSFIGAERQADAAPTLTEADGMRPTLPETPADRKVRVVGPTFFPAPEPEEARPAPAPTRAP